MTRPLTFLTLGPSGTNHELVTRRYLDFHGLDAKVLLIEDFFEGLTMIDRGEADHLIQVAVHPDCADVVARGHFEHGIHIMDAFISPSKELEFPRILALQPATRGYADISAWPEHIPVSSIMRIAEGLFDGTYDSGLTTMKVVEANPDLLRVDVRIGTVDDAWLVFGKTRVSDGNLVAWPTSPGAKLLRHGNEIMEKVEN
ncbi:MAG: hypothetical protein AAGD13_05325 [Pseudomonadota bacterium]